jgi:hypothetical protein
VPVPGDGVDEGGVLGQVVEQRLDTSARGAPEPMVATAASSARLRASVDVVSTMTSSPARPVTTPVLLIIQLPSGWT